MTRVSSSPRDSVPGITGRGWGGAATALLAKDNFMRFLWPKDGLIFPGKSLISSDYSVLSGRRDSTPHT